MKLAFVVSLSSTSFEYIAQGDNLEAVLGELASLGYDGVELGIRDPAAVSLNELKPLLQTHKLIVPAIGTGQAFVDEQLSFTDPDPGVRAKAMERFRRHIDLAAVLGARVIIGLLRGRPKDLKKGRAQFVEALREGCAYAAKNHPDVGILVEPINRYETPLVNTIQEAADVIRDAGGDGRLGILADTFHMNIEEADMAASLKAAGPLVKHFHVADSNRWVPGNGHLDFKPLLDTLQEMGYNGFVSAECLMKPVKERAYAQNMEFFTGLLGPSSR